MEKQISDVLKSKRFWTMIVGIVVMLFVAAAPAFADVEAQLIENITYLALLAIAGYSLQDLAREIVPTARLMAAQTPTPIDDAVVGVLAAALGTKDKSSGDPSAVIES